VQDGIFRVPLLSGKAFGFSGIFLPNIFLAHGVLQVYANLITVLVIHSLHLVWRPSSMVNTNLEGKDTTPGRKLYRLWSIHSPKA
jgi:hypothetical protein